MLSFSNMIYTVFLALAVQNSRKQIKTKRNKSQERVDIFQENHNDTTVKVLRIQDYSGTQIKFTTASGKTLILCYCSIPLFPLLIGSGRKCERSHFKGRLT